MNKKSQGLQRTFLLLWAFMGALALMACALIFHYVEYDSIYFKGGSDDLQYELDALYTAVSGNFILLDLRSSIYNMELHNSPGYLFYLAAIQETFSVNKQNFVTFVPRVFNGAFIVLIALLASKICKDLSAARKSNYVFLLLAFSPLYAYYAAFNFRDTIISFLILTATYYAIKFNNRNSLRPLFLLILSILILYYFRSLNAIVSFLVITSFLFFNLKKKLPKSYALIFSITFFVVGTVVVANVIATLFEQLDYVAMRIAHYSEVRGSASSFIQSAVYSRDLFPLGVFLRGGYGILSPFPIPVFGADRIFLNLAGFVHFFLLPFAFFGGIKMFKLGGIHKFVLAMFFAGFLPYAYGSGTTRHILTYYPFFVIMAVHGVGVLRVSRGFSLAALLIVLESLVIMSLSR